MANAGGGESTGGRGAAAPTPASTVSHVDWPAIVRGQAATLQVLQHQLEDSQWWPPSAIEAHQCRQLERLLAHAWRSVPFYRHRLTALAGLRRGTLTVERWRQLPVLTRRDVQTAGEALQSRTVPRDHRPLRDARSSGSTGRPVAVTTTAVTGLFFTALNRRLQIWNRMDPSASVAALRVLRGEEEERARRDEPIGWVPGYRSGPMYLFPATAPVDDQLAWLRRVDPDYLLTNPSNLRHLLRRAAAANVRMPRLRRVMTMTEIVDESLRRACHDAWGVAIADAYSAMEVGMIAIQCPEAPGYHVQSESLLVEVLDDAGAPCGPGETGRVVVTDLHNFAMPLIRYEIGDFAEAGAACACGRGLPVLARIVGRVRNMVTYPNGDTAWPLPWLSSELMPLAPIDQIQLVQRTRHDIDVRLVTPRPLTAEEEAALAALFTRRLGHAFAYRFVYEDAIERSAGGKFEDFVSLLEPQG